MLGFHGFAIHLLCFGRFLRAAPYFEGPSHVNTCDISRDVLQTSLLCRFLLKTPIVVIPASLGLPSGGLLASWTLSRTPLQNAGSLPLLKT